MIHKVAREFFEEFRVRRRIGSTEIINWFDDAATEEVEPDAVGLNFGEKWIFRRGHPIGEGGEFVFVRRGSGFAKKAGFGGFAGAGVLHLCGGSEINDLFAFKFVAVIVVATAVFEDFIFEAGEDALPIVVIVLAPSVEGMIVALGALHPRAEEKLGAGFGAFEWRAGGAVEICGRIFVSAATCGNDLAGKLVDGFALKDAGANPSVEELEAFAIENSLLRAKEVHPFKSPEVCEFGSFEKMINEARAFAR